MHSSLLSTTPSATRSKDPLGLERFPCQDVVVAHQFRMAEMMGIAGLVLINSAGLIKPGYTPEEAANPSDQATTQTGPPGVVADVVTNVLMFYLERSVPRCCHMHLSGFLSSLCTCSRTKKQRCKSIIDSFGAVEVVEAFSPDGGQISTMIWDGLY